MKHLINDFRQKTCKIAFTNIDKLIKIKQLRILAKAITTQQNLNTYK